MHDVIYGRYEQKVEPLLGFLSFHTKCFTDLGKLNMLLVDYFRLKPIYATAPAASTKNPQFKSGQN